MKINPYKYLTPAYIDWLLDKPLLDLSREVDLYYSEMYQQAPLTKIQENRPFKRYLAKPTLIKRNNQFYRITNNQHTYCNKGDVWDDMKFVYVSELDLWLEMVTLLNFVSRGVSGGSPYCKHTIKNSQCTYCGAVASLLKTYQKEGNQ